MANDQPTPSAAVGEADEQRLRTVEAHAGAERAAALRAEYARELRRRRRRAAYTRHRLLARVRRVGLRLVRERRVRDRGA